MLRMPVTLAFPVFLLPLCADYVLRNFAIHVSAIVDFRHYLMVSIPGNFCLNPAVANR